MKLVHHFSLSSLIVIMSYMTFITKFDSLDPPTNISVGEIKSTSVEIYWDEVPEAATYYLRIRMKIAQGVWAEWEPWQRFNGEPLMKHTFKNLEPDTFYQFEIYSSKPRLDSEVVSDWFISK